MGTRRHLRRLRHDLLYLLVLLARALAIVLPRWLGLALFGLVGRAVFVAGGVDRRRTVKHLTLIYGDRWDRARIQRPARDVYVHLGKNLFDAVRLPLLDNRAHDRVVRHDPVDAMLAVQKSGKGLVCITAHTGCFEMLLPFFGRKGIRGFAVGQRLFDRRIDAIVTKARANWNMEYVYRSDSPREIIKRLRDGMALGVLIDQDTAVEGVFAHFMGRLAYTPSGPVKLAMKLKLPLFVATVARVAGNRHHVFISEELKLATGGEFGDDLVRNVEKVNAIICATIERYPEQWVWMHRRWRRRPESPAYAAVPNVENL
jgi:KDO2-lipid IV(A) lauroyltransferase